MGECESDDVDRMLGVSVTQRHAQGRFSTLTHSLPSVRCRCRFRFRVLRVDEAQMKLYPFLYAFHPAPSCDLRKRCHSAVQMQVRKCAARNLQSVVRS